MASPRILVVDDDKLIRWSVSEVLGQSGYLIEEAASGAEGLAAIRRAPPDAILLDVSLPDVDGFSVLKTIREAHANLPVLIMTADATRETVRQALQFGANGYLDKPCDAAALRAAVSQALLPPSRLLPGGEH